jgi:acylphosphatase
VSTVRRRVLAHGRVQGVFFRDSTRRLAQDVGAAGYVRNRADGTVEAVFEGSPEAVGALIDFCRWGPPDAEVERLDIVEEPPEGLVGFRVTG